MPQTNIQQTHGPETNLQTWKNLLEKLTWCLDAQNPFLSLKNNDTDDQFLRFDYRNRSASLTALSMT